MDFAWFSPIRNQFVRWVWKVFGLGFMFFSYLRFFLLAVPCFCSLPPYQGADYHLQFATLRDASHDACLRPRPRARAQIIGHATQLWLIYTASFPRMGSAWDTFAPASQTFPPLAVGLRSRRGAPSYRISKPPTARTRGLVSEARGTSPATEKSLHKCIFLIAVCRNYVRWINI